MKNRIASYLEFENLYQPVRDTLFDVGLAGPSAEIVDRNEDPDRGTFDVVFQTAHPGLFLRVEGQLPFRSRETVYEGYARLTFATAEYEPGEDFEEWEEVRSARVNGNLSGPYSVSMVSITAADWFKVKLATILLDIAAEMLPHFEDIKAEVTREIGS